ncbi:uncharacterized protein BJX67DRAFT_350706 [Aspergillus lucknowensis]|uniref:Major facilitator superfamily (MFS) profile domain-containing protein n=1 Tax=Aspergillus lucknowensis TaxID=176173 RepID=A0ABR4LV99_9EURO
MIFGATGITIALFCEAALNSQNEEGLRMSYSIGSVFVIFCVTISFSWSFGPCSWHAIFRNPPSPFAANERCGVYMAEVMPMQIRGRGNAFAPGVGKWAVSTIWAQGSPIALGKTGWKFNFIFAAWRRYPPSLRTCLRSEC